MKICYLADINNYHTKKWCEYFSNKGHEIVIISLSKGELKGCKSYCFDFSNVKQLNTIKKIGYLKNIKKIKEILQIEKPDILHSHYASSYGFIGDLTGYKPHIVSLWGSDILLFPRKSYIHKSIIKKVLNGKTTVFSTSEYMIEEANKYLKKSKKIELTPFGVNINIFKPKTVIKNEKFIIGVNKSLEEVSGIDILLKAISKAFPTEMSDGWELRIAGIGSQQNSLLNLAKDLKIENNIKFYGYLNQIEIVDFLQKLNLAVYPSLSESFGVAAVEAQACGIPVIVSDVQGFKESTLPNETSFLFKRGSEIDLINKIKILYENDEKRLSMSLKGPEFVRNNFNIDNNFSHVYDLYSSIVKEYKE